MSKIRGLVVKKLLLFISLIFLSTVLLACDIKTEEAVEQARGEAENTEGVSDKIKENGENTSEEVKDYDNNYPSVSLYKDDSLYKEDDNNSIKYLYITIQKDQGSKGYSLSDLNKDTDKYDDYKPELNVIFQEGTETGPENGPYGQEITNSNAVLKIRGSSTRNAEQKSFKIKLNKKADLWNGNRTINLNKHPYDDTKLRNKLSFDYFIMIPDFITLRTQFVKLYIKDLNKPDPDQKFVNYGLFTQIEEADDDFLARRGLDSNGNLYKANFFEFWQPDQMVNVDSPKYSKNEFERYLEIKAGKDHSKLLAMVKDVMDETMDIDEVVDKHFNRNNYLTWLAINIIMGNIDTGSQNYYLYSPQDSSTWYFLPWDYDGAWRFYDPSDESRNPPPWQRGVTNYGGVVLTRRFLTKETNVTELKSKVEELSSIINSENTSKMLYGYFDAVKGILEEEPDQLDLNRIKEDIENIIITPEKNIKYFYDSLKIPMPVFTGAPEECEDNKIYFPWNESYCPCGGEISYTLTIARDLDFQNIVLNIENIKETNYLFDQLEKGTYYFRLAINCSQGNRQVTYDTYIDKEGNKHYGIREVVIE